MGPRSRHQPTSRKTNLFYIAVPVILIIVTLFLWGSIFGSNVAPTPTHVVSPATVAKAMQAKGLQEAKPRKLPGTAPDSGFEIRALVTSKGFYPFKSNFGEDLKMAYVTGGSYDPIFLMVLQFFNFSNEINR